MLLNNGAWLRVGHLAIATRIVRLAGWRGRSLRLVRFKGLLLNIAIVISRSRISRHNWSCLNLLWVVISSFVVQSYCLKKEPQEALWALDADMSHLPTDLRMKALSMISTRITTATKHLEHFVMLGVVIFAPHIIRAYLKKAWHYSHVLQSSRYATWLSLVFERYTMLLTTAW